MQILMSFVILNDSVSVHGKLYIEITGRSVAPENEFVQQLGFGSEFKFAIELSFVFELKMDLSSNSDLILDSGSNLEST
jgi:hypothetical protein